MSDVRKLVKVKPLEWVETEDCDGESFHTTTPLGVGCYYAADHVPTSDGTPKWRLWCSLARSDILTLHDNLEAAKAAAQADYDARILAALIPLPDAHVAGLREAAWEDVLNERRRQVEVEGWTPARDDAYTSGELAMAGGCYALASCRQMDFARADALRLWPWDRKWWKPTNRRRDLVKAGALILAEIERLDRAAEREGGSHE